MAPIGMNRRITLLAVSIAAVIGSMLVANASFAAAANTGTPSLTRMAAYAGRYFDMSQPTFNQLSERYAGLSAGIPDSSARMHRGFNIHRGQVYSGNVTVDSAQAKAAVEASFPSLKVGTIASLRTSWQVPIEDEKGVVLLIQVAKVSASTAEQAKSMVEESMRKGWKAGEPRLMRAIYNVPILDSNDVTIGYVGVDGRSGEIVRRPSTILAVTSEQAKTIVTDAIKEFKVGEVKDRGNVWMVRITYGDKEVMTVLLGKLNTPTSEEAVKAVQDSLSQSWNSGEPEQRRLIYNVPIIDANGNTIGSVKVDGRNGEIIGFQTISSRA